MAPRRPWYTAVMQMRISETRVRPLRRVEFDRLVGLGHFERERVELIDGRIIDLGPQGGPHASAITRLVRLLVPRLSKNVEARIQMPFVAGGTSEPEPDVALVPTGDYELEHPASALLIIEVSDTSLEYDRSVKGALYAKAKVPEYWIVNLEDGAVEVRRLPRGDRFTQVRIALPGETLRPVRLPKLSVPVVDVFPRPSR